MVFYIKLKKYVNMKAFNMKWNRLVHEIMDLIDVRSRTVNFLFDIKPDTYVSSNRYWYKYLGLHQILWGFFHWSLTLRKEITVCKQKMSKNEDKFKFWQNLLYLEMKKRIISAFFSHRKTKELNNTVNKNVLSKTY